MEIEEIDGTEKRTRRGIKRQIYLTGPSGKRVKQWVIVPYPEGDSYKPSNRKRELPKKITPAEDLPKKPTMLRALSVRQPYAEMILTGEKKIEYRSKNTTVRGRIYIYASATKYSKDDTLDIADETGITVEEIKDLPRKVVIGSVEIYDSREVDGRHEWLLKNPIRFTKPRSPDPDQRANPVWFNPFGKEEDS